jgi:hypothetical protein
VDIGNGTNNQVSLENSNESAPIGDLQSELEENFSENVVDHSALLAADF